MTPLSYQIEDTPPALGLIVLQVDETIEGDMRRMLPEDTALHITRVPSADEVSADSLAAMQAHLSNAARLLPPAQSFSCVGYGCTSATAQIGAQQVAHDIRAGCQTSQVTDPLTSLIAACQKLGLRKLAILSPYVPDVTDRLRAVLSDSGVDSPVFGSFNEPVEAKVVRITPTSIRQGALTLAAQGGIDGIFLSCTNLRTLDVIAEIEAETDLPCLSSNQVLAWHMTAGRAQVPGRLGR